MSGSGKPHWRWATQNTWTHSGEMAHLHSRSGQVTHSTQLGGLENVLQYYSHATSTILWNPAVGTGQSMGSNMEIPLYQNIWYRLQGSARDVEDQSWKYGICKPSTPSLPLHHNMHSPHVKYTRAGTRYITCISLRLIRPPSFWLNPNPCKQKCFQKNPTSWRTLLNITFFLLPLLPSQTITAPKPLFPNALPDLAPWCPLDSSLSFHQAQKSRILLRNGYRLKNLKCSYINNLYSLMLQEENKKDIGQRVLLRWCVWMSVCLKDRRNVIMSKDK